MIDDEYIKKLFFGKRQIKNHIYKKYIIEKQNHEIYNYIISRFGDSDSNNIREILHRIYWKVEKIPVCPICGCKVKYTGGDKNGKIYTTYCSCKCAQNDKNVRKKIFDTCFDRYGNNNNIEKYKKTCLERYGVDNFRKTKECVDKIRKTVFEHYGVDNYFKTEDFKLKSHSKEANEKRNETKRKNKTFNTSKPEKISYFLLKEVFGEVLKQYKSEQYPFFCDFYVPKLDLYIELNIFWHHGKRPYTGSEEDLKKIEEWKSRGTESYLEAIKTWTERDVNKRTIAKQNNLNYLEFFNMKQLKDFLYDRQKQRL